MSDLPPSDWAALQADLEGSYRIERPLGEGGMASVYLARDLKHDRDVAMKVLRPHLASAIGPERFLAEIRTTANLHHPHILPLFDSGEAGGSLYFVTPVVVGESLRQRIDRQGPLPVEEAVQVASEVAGALEYAHRHGVIHRDIKPENILLHDGGALVADFGIALASHSAGPRLTETGMAIGTPTYMSPEQALGEGEVDERCDIYALGATLYEALTGAPPFEGATAQAVLAKLLTASPTAPSRRRREVPTHLDNIVLRALAKDPAERFPSVSVMHDALREPGRVAQRRPRLLLPAALAGVAVLGAALALTLRPSGAVARASSIAVLPFENQTRDTAYNYLSDGISEDLIDNLSNFHAIDVREASASFHYRDPGQDLRDVAHALNNVDQIVTGRLEQVGATIRVAAQLHDIRLNKPIWAHTYEHDDIRNLGRLMADIADSIAAKLQLQLTTDVAARRQAPDSVAHDLVLRGRYLLETRDPRQMERAIALFSDAILRDSSYAAAWAGRADARDLTGAFEVADPAIAFASAKVDVRHALSLDPDLAEAHSTLGFIHTLYDHDWPGAAAEFTRAIALDPNQSPTWLFRAWSLVAVGQLDSAVASVQHARRLDSQSLINAIRLGSVLRLAGRREEARRAYHDALRLDVGNSTARAEMAMFEAEGGHCAVADTAIKGLDPGSNQLLAGWIASVDALCGRAPRARAYAQALNRRALQGEYIDPYWAALVTSRLKDEEDTRQWLEDGVAGHALLMFQVRADPAFRQYRTRPWFHDLLVRLNML